MKATNIARVRLENGMVHFYNFYDRLPDANLLRQKKYRFRQNAKSEWLESIPAADHEKIAKFVEFLALSSYGRNFSKTVGPPEVYRIWAGCVKNATGIILRKPRLSEIYGLGVPLNITGNKCDNPPGDDFGEVIEIFKVENNLSHEDVVNLHDNAFAIRSHEPQSLRQQTAGAFPVWRTPLAKPFSSGLRCQLRAQNPHPVHSRKRKPHTRTPAELPSGKRMEPGACE